MPHFCCNKNAQTNGDHEVHQDDCRWIPEPHNQINLGYHATCKTAVLQAKAFDPRADGCKYCSPECHTR
jgi:hypothetical protein